MKLALVLAAALLTMFLLPGCSRTSMQKQLQRERIEQKKNALKDIPGGVEGNGWHVTWYVRNHNTPDAPLLTSLKADAARGVVINHHGDPKSQLWQVQARLYQNGAIAADIKAGSITADQKSRVVNGNGGVKIVSRKNPPDTVITSKRMVWDTRTSLVQALGDVIARHYQKGKLSSEEYGQKMTYDINTGDLTVQE